MGKRKRASLFSKILSRLLWLIASVITVYFCFKLYKLNILPIKHYLIIIGVLIFIMLIIGLILFRKKLGKKLVEFILLVLLIYLTICTFASLRINKTIDFLKNNLGLDFETNIYYVLVNDDSTYKELGDIKGRNIYSFKESKNEDLIESGLLDRVDVNISYKDSIYDLLNQLTYDEDLIVYVNSGNYDVMVQNNGEYVNYVRILDTIEIKTKKEVEKSDIDVKKEPFVILINGIDTRSDYLPSRSLSDVNMLVAINPNTHRILLVGIPRDYYLTIPGTEYKDKLTHTGTIGGVDTTISTLENAFDIEISHYIRVNFNFVVNLVDAVDGINIYNDETYTFTCSSDDCTFEPEWNYNVNGRCTLAFARERYAYSSGDSHRVENQQQVIKRLFEKITSSKTLISSYDKILNSLNGTFETSLSNNEISSLVKMQLNDMPDWYIESYRVTGTGDSAYTYSYPNQELYVMIPDDYSVEEAINRLNEILESDE